MLEGTPSLMRLDGRLHFPVRAAASDARADYLKV